MMSSTERTRRLLTLSPNAGGDAPDRRARKRWSERRGTSANTGFLNRKRVNGDYADASARPALRNTKERRCGWDVRRRSLCAVAAGGGGVRGGAACFRVSASEPSA